MKTTVLTFVIITFSLLLNGQNTDYRGFINRDTLQKHVRFLASDSLKGRNTGSEGQLIAADYIENAFMRYGLEGINYSNPVSPYFQAVDLSYIVFPNVNLISDTGAISIRYRIAASDDRFSQKMNFQFCGNGDILPDKLEKDVNTIMINYDEDKDLAQVFKQIKENSDVRQVIVLLPKNTADVKQFNRIRYRQMDYVRNFFNKGPVDHPLLSLIMNHRDTTFHFMYVVKSAIEDLTGEKPGYWLKKERKLNRIGYSSIEKSEISGDIKIDFSGTPHRVFLNAPNVAGFLPGKDTTKTIVVGAHYDHLGHRGENIYNGADDNASGTAGVMELARIFAMEKENGDPPPCNILFIAFTAEEKGLIGSKYYTENPLIPLERTMGMFNMDMIGRQEWLRKNDGDPYVFMLRRRDGRDMKRMVKVMDNSDNYDLDVLHGHGLRGLFWIIGSDHYWFMRNDIPVAVFFTASHDDYHRPTDTEEKITYDSMTEIVRLVFDAMVEWGGK
jgi:thiol-disulfide isomerase/thioredoxin